MYKSTARIMHNKEQGVEVPLGRDSNKERCDANECQIVAMQLIA